jgi:hypothetical protein
VVGDFFLFFFLSGGWRGHRDCLSRGRGAIEISTRREGWRRMIATQAG